MAMTQALRAGARRLELAATLTLETGEAVALDGSDILSVEIQEGADAALTPGCVLSANAVMTLDNAGGRWLGLEGERCALQGATAQLALRVLDGETWRCAPMGVYIIDRVSACEQKAVIRASGSDSVSSELAPAFEDRLSYPATLEQLWRHAVSQTRYEWDDSVPNGGATIDARPEWGEISVRQAMGFIAQAAGCFVQVDREGALRLAPCRRVTPQAALTPDCYMSLTRGFERFGPVNALRVLPMPDAERNQEALIVTADAAAGETLTVQNNPLFVHGAAHLRALAEGMLGELSGLTLTKAEFRWRGDPAVGVGSRVEVTDTRGEAHAATVTRQTLRFDGGLTATCACETPNLDGSGVRRLITPEGGLDAGHLVGTLDGGLLAAGSITARTIAAQSITAEHLAAGAVTAQSIEAVRAHIRQLVAGEITADQLYADLATIAAAEIASATIDHAQIRDLAAEVARIAAAQIDTAHIREANIDWAAIANLTAQIATIARAQIGTASLEQADIDWARITNLSAAIADLADARIGRATITTAQIADLTAQIAGVIRLSAQRGDFDFAAVRDLVAGAMILTQGVGGTVTIENLLATSAMFVQATLGELVLKGRDGKYYAVSVMADGAISTQEVAVTPGEADAGETATGRPIVETQADIAHLSAGDLHAQSAVIATLFTAALQAEKISASQAFLASATVPELYVTAIRALGDTLDISANESVRTTVGGAIAEAMDGLKVGGRNYLRSSRSMLREGLHGFVERGAIVLSPVADECVADDCMAGA